VQLRVGVGVQHLARRLALALVHWVERHAPQDEIQLDRAGSALGEQRGEMVADVGFADPELVLAHELGQVGQAFWLLGHRQPLENGILRGVCVCDSTPATSAATLFSWAFEVADPKLEGLWPGSGGPGDPSGEGSRRDM
jgi:hypothetical protein